jgi:hypothetical protein
MPRAFVLEMDPSRFRPSLSVQASWNGGFGIIRGARACGRLLEDHVLHRGRRVSGARLIRRGVWSVARHREVWMRAHPGSRIAAWVGNGNLLANPHFVASTGNVLYALAGEPLETRSYTCLVVRPHAVSIETLHGDQFPPHVECATFGQQVVKGGAPLDREGLIAKAAAGEFADLRHLFLFPRLPLGEERWIDAGLAAMYNESGRQNPAAVEAALRGSAIEVDVTQFPECALRHALAVKGYRDFELRDGVLRFVLRPGIYPHNMIGIREDGTVISVAVQGLSNRVGVTVAEAAGIMQELGAADALLLDNGADVAMARGGELIVGGRERLRSVLFFHGGPGLPRLESFRVG